MKRATTIAWKEVLEFLRDKKSIALMIISAFLFPILGLVVTGLQTHQEAPIAVLVCDKSRLANMFANKLVHAIVVTPGLEPVLVNGSVTNNCSLPSNVVAGILIPRGFGVNASDINKPVYIYFYRVVGKAAADQAATILNNIAAEFAHNISISRIRVLAKKAGITVNPDYIRNPVYIVSESVSAGGAPVSPEIVAKANTARFLAFSVFFVLNPAAIAIADAIARERESGTGELLAITPVTGFELLLGKTAGALVAASIAGGIDALAAIAYTSLVLGGLDAGLVAVHVTGVLLAVLVTAAFTMLITLLVPGQRAATLTASMITGFATIIFLSALFVDYSTLPLSIRLAFYMIPYTYVVAAIKSYALGAVTQTILYLLVLLVLTILALIGSAKVYSPERLVKRS
ncbi:ABC transporter permease [Pyrofollis japonicus]|uniref:ABC transporter permease n=1 Tax=Pyrofollis japonicus TaxID=3060460 RepID=UPI00295AB446|nr:ABC transporter permease [Pyrofollis japonicus]BEP17705.1 ABC transporter permease [Pyrofollis japonicus]